MTYWTYIEKEILDLEETFKNIFESTDFHRDYANVWEWLEGESDWIKGHVNISREHNWKSGEYSKPLLIMIESTDTQFEEEELIFSIGNKLCEGLQEVVYYGEMKCVNDHQGREYIYEIDTKFTPKDKL